MAASALLSITLVPVLATFAYRRPRPHRESPVLRWASAAYVPALRAALRFYLDGNGRTLDLDAMRRNRFAQNTLMREFCARFPDYCFGQHKGYGTELHLIKLHEHGPCPIHRRSFEPVAQPLLSLELVARGEVKVAEIPEATPMPA